MKTDLSIPAVDTGDRRIRTRPMPDCRICGSEGTALYGGLRDRLFGAPGVWELVLCSNADCRLVWPNPAPVPEDLHVAYRHYYTHKARGRVSSAVYRLMALAYEVASALPGRLVGLGHERQRIRYMYLDDVPAGTLFDVGCGDGKFLHRMQRRGWLGTGIDVDASAVAAGRARYGLDLLAGDFLTAAIADRAFDAVTLSHVIEHVVDPVATLRRCRELLRPGGRLVLTTPNSQGMGHAHFGRHWRGLEPPRHLLIFSPQVLDECVRSAGFVVDRVGTTAANADYIGAASYSIQRAADGAQIGGRWKLDTALAGVVFQYREHLAMRRDPLAGEEVYLVATRADP